MASRDLLAGLGSAIIEARLSRLRGPATEGRASVVNVFNVESIAEYQKQDIDLVVHVRNAKKDNTTEVVTIEVKADNYPSGDVAPGENEDAGNFFFETVSNDSKAVRTKGCFMYTHSKMLYYLFLPTGTLYQLPTNATREWFKEELNYTDNWYYPDKCDLHKIKKKDARWRYTSTIIGGRVRYNTWGVVLPVKQVLQDVEAFSGQKIKKQDVLEDVVRVGHAQGVLHHVWEKMPEATKLRAAAFLHKHDLNFPPGDTYVKAVVEAAATNTPTHERRVEVWNLFYRVGSEDAQPRSVRWSNWETLKWNPDQLVFEFGSSRGFAGSLDRLQVEQQFPGMIEVYIRGRNQGLDQQDVVDYMKREWGKT